MRLDTQILTSNGLTQVTIRRVNYAGKEMFAVDLWRGSDFLDSQITVFCAGVLMQWNGKGYEIIRNRPTEYTNAIWIELERLVANVISINE
jgi:hypothetical protein